MPGVGSHREHHAGDEAQLAQDIRRKREILVQAMHAYNAQLTSLCACVMDSEWKPSMWQPESSTRSNVVNAKVLPRVVRVDASFGQALFGDNSGRHAELPVYAKVPFPSETVVKENMRHPFHPIPLDGPKAEGGKESGIVLSKRVCKFSFASSPRDGGEVGSEQAQGEDEDSRCLARHLFVSHRGNVVMGICVSTQVVPSRAKARGRDRQTSPTASTHSVVDMVVRGDARQTMVRYPFMTVINSARPEHLASVGLGLYKRTLARPVQGSDGIQWLRNMDDGASSERVQNGKTVYEMKPKVRGDDASATRRVPIALMAMYRHCFEQLRENEKDEIRKQFVSMEVVATLGSIASVLVARLSDGTFDVIIHRSKLIPSDEGDIPIVVAHIPESSKMPPARSISSSSRSAAPENPLQQLARIATRPVVMKDVYHGPKGGSMYMGSYDLVHGGFDGDDCDDYDEDVGVECGEQVGVAEDSRHAQDFVECARAMTPPPRTESFLDSIVRRTADMVHSHGSLGVW